MMTESRRRQTHSANVSLRINPLLLDRVEQAAVEQGMSIAEFARHALGHQLRQIDREAV